MIQRVPGGQHALWYATTGISQWTAIFPFYQRKGKWLFLADGNRFYKFSEVCWLQAPSASQRISQTLATCRDLTFAIVVNREGVPFRALKCLPCVTCSVSIPDCFIYCVSHLPFSKAFICPPPCTMLALIDPVMWTYSFSFIQYFGTSL